MDCEQLTTVETMGNNSDGISGFAPTMASPHDPTTTAMGSTLSGQPYPSMTAPGGSSSNNFEPATLSWFTQGTSSPSMTQTTSNTAASPRSTGHSASSRTNSIIYTPPSPTNTIEPIQLDYRIPPSPEEFPGKRRMSSGSVSKRKEGREQEERKSLTQAKPARGHEPCAKKSTQSPKETVTPDQLQKDTNSNDSNDHSLSEQSNESQLQKHRQSMLKRNSMAARKCRAKTKAAVADLEATEKAMCTEHYRLSTTVTGLREEVLMLKNELLKHGNCDCEIIQQYLTNAAKKIANGTAQGESGVSSASSQP
ncbi:hypothetical protein F5883DRAFT_650346 [Diaporthe sp. PMI_573]|nr:hypothetical protein F5883DRAFT_650346 [Diaporthaceae sp. PMI_573]